MTTPIRYTTGDASHPEGEGTTPIIIAHIVNDVGAWGAGFVLAIERRWYHVRRRYLQWEPELGRVQFVAGEPMTLIANMCAQRGIGRDPDGKPPIRYDALRTCLHNVAAHAKEFSSEVHMPRIGCGLAGGTWDKIEPIVLETLADRGVQVVVYDYKETP